MISILQILVILYALGMMYFALLHFRRKEISTQEMVVWGVIWILLIIIVLFPDILRTYARTYLSTRLFDLIVIGGVTLSLLMVTKAYLTSRKLEKKIEDLVRKEALRKVKKSKK